MVKYKRFLFLFILLILIFISSVLILWRNKYRLDFNAERAYQDVAYQLSFGPRIMGSEAHEQVAEWLVNGLREQGWQVDTQETFLSGNQVKNIIAKRGDGTPWVILGSHYDSRTFADQDPNPENRIKPVMGANDGASSVAILLELARVISKDIDKQIWLVFFDNEDNGTTSGNGWVIGSSYFVSQLKGTPDSVVILDMVGDKDLNIYMERNSSAQLNNEIWSTAKSLGYTQFIASYKFGLLDDHTPFIQAGITAADIIDFHYSYWHTTQDTLDKISANSLKVVGETILSWLTEYPK
jgi:glutaminyl-peptide cyclotransferase